MFHISDLKPEDNRLILFKTFDSDRIHIGRFSSDLDGDVCFVEAHLKLTMLHNFHINYGKFLEVEYWQYYNRDDYEWFVSDEVKPKSTHELLLVDQGDDNVNFAYYTGSQIKIFGQYQLVLPPNNDVSFQICVERWAYFKR